MHALFHYHYAFVTFLFDIDADNLSVIKSEQVHTSTIYLIARP